MGNSKSQTLEIRYNKDYYSKSSTSVSKVKLIELQNGNYCLSSYADHKSLYDSLKIWLKLDKNAQKPGKPQSNMESKDLSISDLQEDLSSLMIDSISVEDNFFDGYDDISFNLVLEPIKSDIEMANKIIEDKLFEFLEERNETDKKLRNANQMSQKYEDLYITAHSNFLQFKEKLLDAERNYAAFVEKFHAADRNFQEYKKKYLTANQNLVFYKEKCVTAERDSKTLTTKQHSAEQNIEEYKKGYLSYNEILNKQQKKLQTIRKNFWMLSEIVLHSLKNFMLLIEIFKNSRKNI